MADETSVEGVESVETETETVESSGGEATARVYLTNEEFYDIHERIMGEPEPSIEKVAEATGLTVNSAKARRSKWNATFKPHGLSLTAFPRGRSIAVRTEEVNELAAKLKANLMARKAEQLEKEAKANAETESDV